MLNSQYNWEEKQNILTNVHNNYVNGNKKDAIEDIVDYGVSDFFVDYKEYLEHIYNIHDDMMNIYTQYTNVVNSFFVITDN